MADQKDIHPEASGKTKNINSSAVEQGDMDPAAEANTTNNQNFNDTSKTGDDNGFFSLDGDMMETPEEHEKDKHFKPSAQQEKVDVSQTENREAFPQHYTRSMTPKDIESENSNLKLDDDDAH